MPWHWRKPRSLEQICAGLAPAARLTLCACPSSAITFEANSLPARVRTIHRKATDSGRWLAGLKFTYRPKISGAALMRLVEKITRPSAHRNLWKCSPRPVENGSERSRGNSRITPIRSQVTTITFRITAMPHLSRSVVCAMAAMSTRILAILDRFITMISGL